MAPFYLYLHTLKYIWNDLRPKYHKDYMEKRKYNSYWGDADTYFPLEH